jgi:hypothetical protein
MICDVSTPIYSGDDIHNKKLSPCIARRELVAKGNIKG